MKKWLGMMLVLTTITTACSSTDGGEPKDQGNEAANSEGKKVVTLSIRQSSAFYQTLEKKFEEKYPNIDLKIQAYKQIGEKLEPEDYEKYPKTANTELLSGKGADIFEVSSLPLDEYVDKQLFLNMDDLMAQDRTLDKSDLEMSVLNAIKLNGVTYAIPSGFSLRAFVGDGDAVKNKTVDDKNWTWEQFEDFSKGIIRDEQASGKQQRYALADTPPDVLLQEMFVDHYAEFVDPAAKTAKFDTPLFVGMLKQIKQMYDDKVMAADSGGLGKQLFYSIVVQSPADLVNGPHAYFANPVLLNKPHEQGQSGGMRIIPLSQFAIRAQSPVKEEAWTFMNFLLSADGQSLQEREGFSLDKSVNDKLLSGIQEQVKSGAFKLPDGKSVQVPDEEFDHFKQIVHTADNYALLDAKVLSIVGEEAYAFYGGQKSAEETAKLIQNRTTTYLNE